MKSTTPGSSTVFSPGPRWLAAERAGYDMDLLAESLSLSPAERLRLHAIALRRVELLEAAMRKTFDVNRPVA
jgi:hypothetical protein